MYELKGLFNKKFGVCIKGIITKTLQYETLKYKSLQFVCFLCVLNTFVVTAFYFT